jgi:hypothetical protein
MRTLIPFEDAPGYAKDATDGTIVATDRTMLENFKKRAKAFNRIQEMEQEINILKSKLTKKKKST